MSNTLVIDAGEEVPSITYIIIPDSDINDVERSILEFMTKSYDEIKDKMKDYNKYQKLFKSNTLEGGKWSKYVVEAYYESIMSVNKTISKIYYLPFH